MEKQPFQEKRPEKSEPKAPIMPETASRNSKNWLLNLK